MKDSPYKRRLRRDFNEIENLAKSSDLIDFEYFGDPPNRYIITYKCKGILRSRDGTFYYSEFHQVQIRLGANYPTTRPDIKFLTPPIFHPNVSDLNGAVCIGHWTPSLKLSEWIINIGEMIQYKRYNVEDPLNISAAEWAKNNKSLFPVDKRELVKEIKSKILNETEEFRIVIKSSNAEEKEQTEKIVITFDGDENE